MRTKIALIVVLASFLAASALGAGLAGAEPLADNVPVGPAAATTTTAIPSLQGPACANGADDDGDGLVDLADPDCTSPTGTSEATVPSGADASSPAPVAPNSSGAVHQGASIGGGGGEEVRGGVSHNDSLGDSSGGGGADGAVSAPTITGGGDQPLAGAGDGGSQFSDGGSPTLANPTTTIESPRRRLRPEAGRHLR